MEAVDISAVKPLLGELNGIFDSHCHYDDGAFDEDREQLLAYLMSDDSPVCMLMHACTDLDSAEYGIGMAQRFAGYYTSVGIHPETLDKQYGVYKNGLPDNYIAKLRMLAGQPKVMAIGEIGLDHHYDGYDAYAQSQLFISQLELAKELDMPVIMHCRDATEEFLEIMKKYRPKGVVHCFSGSAETAKQLLDLGLYIGFTGALAFKNSKKAKRAFLAVPYDRLLFETDCPYMAPPPFRGKRCYSEMICCVAAEAENLSGIPAQQLVDITRENALRLFGINIEAR